MGPSSGETCVYAKLGTCYSVWMTVGCAGAYAPAPYIITSTKCRTNTIVSPDDGPIIGRNM